MTQAVAALEPMIQAGTCADPRLRPVGKKAARWAWFAFSRTSWYNRLRNTPRAEGFS